VPGVGMASRNRRWLKVKRFVPSFGADDRVMRDRREAAAETRLAAADLHDWQNLMLAVLGAAQMPKTMRQRFSSKNVDSPFLALIRYESDLETPRFVDLRP
jgi:hypothetical protein